MVESLGHAIGSVGVLLLIPAALCWFALSVALPFLCWSVVRNVARTRRAAERIADAIEAGRAPGSGGVLGL